MEIMHRREFIKIAAAGASITAVGGCSTLKTSQKNCKELFLSFLAFVGYNDINLFICEKKPEKIRYLYLTQSATCKGVKMEIVIS